MLAQLAPNASLRKSTSRSTCVPIMAFRVATRAERVLREGVGVAEDSGGELILVGESGKEKEYETLYG